MPPRSRLRTRFRSHRERTAEPKVASPTKAEGVLSLVFGIPLAVCGLGYAFLGLGDVLTHAFGSRGTATVESCESMRKGADLCHALFRSDDNPGRSVRVLLSIEDEDVPGQGGRVPAKHLYGTSAVTSGTGDETFLSGFAAWLFGGGGIYLTRSGWRTLRRR